MADALAITKEVRANLVVLQLDGVITEDSQLDGLVSYGAKSVVVDLARVERINSYGIRQWINALKAIKETVEDLVFINCPPIIVEQFNMISNFGAGGLVYSFYLPFYNEDTDESRLVLYALPRGEVPSDVESIPGFLLSEMGDGDSFEFNDIEDEYFSFLEHQQGKVVPAHVVEALG